MHRLTGSISTARAVAGLFAARLEQQAARPAVAVSSTTAGAGAAAAPPCAQNSPPGFPGPQAGAMQRPLFPPPLSAAVVQATTAATAATAALALEDADGDDEDLCVVCFEAQRDVVLVPCGHMMLCRHCAGAVIANSAECPVCREAIIDHCVLDIVAPA